MMVTKHILVTGNVQGVGFRYHTKELATLLGLEGWVRNLDDGRVELVVRGDDSDVNDLLQWLKSGGPGAASVSDVDVSDVTEEPILNGEFQVKLGD